MNSAHDFTSNKTSNYPIFRMGTSLSSTLRGACQFGTECTLGCLRNGSKEQTFPVDTFESATGPNHQLPDERKDGLRHFVVCQT